MERFFHSIVAASLLLMILLATEMGPIVVRGKTCEIASYDYKWSWCISSAICRETCKDEGFEGGECKGSFLDECICTYNC
ncbi:hypothetical protein GQ457_17G013840 [Hibiscus cannabinus]